MPPRASATRKKSRPEMQYDELQRALLERVASQPSAQPSQSPALPLVLPSPSTHSTTSSTASTTTGASLPVHNIRSRHAVAEATISGTQASSSNKKRGVVTGKKTAVIVRTSGKSRVTYDLAVSGSPKEAAVESARTDEVEKMMADLPPIDEVLDGTTPTSALTPPLVLSYETQVSVLETVVGPSRGTRVRGLGSGSAKLPQKRGPSSQMDSGRSAELEVEVAQLRAHLAAIEEQLQRERAEWESERERERLDFERKVQAQFEYMLRAAGIQPPNPPLDGSSSAPIP